MDARIIAELMPQALEELRNEKICLIEDIFKVRRISHGIGVPENEAVFSEPGKVFDELYDLSIDQLQLEYATRSALMSRRARELAGFQANEYPYFPMDDSK